MGAAQSLRQGVSEESVQLVEDLLDWRECVRKWIAQTENAGELAVLIIELEAQLAFDLSELDRAKKKVRALTD